MRGTFGFVVSAIIAMSMSVVGAGWARAAVFPTLFTSGFESPTYSPGVINGQDGWTGSSNADIQSAIVSSGTQAMHLNSQTNFADGDHPLVAALAGVTMMAGFDFYHSGTNGQALSITGDTGLIGQLAAGVDGIHIGNTSNATPDLPFALNTWHHVTWTLNFSTLTMSGAVDNTPLGSIPINNATLPTSTTQFSFFSFAGAGAAQDSYLDNLTIFAPEPTFLSALAMIAPLLSRGVLRRRPRS